MAAAPGAPSTNNYVLTVAEIAAAAGTDEFKGMISAAEQRFRASGESRRMGSPNADLKIRSTLRYENFRVINAIIKSGIQALCAGEGRDVLNTDASSHAESNIAFDLLRGVRDKLTGKDRFSEVNVSAAVATALCLKYGLGFKEALTCVGALYKAEPRDCAVKLDILSVEGIVISDLCTAPAAPEAGSVASSPPLSVSSEDEVVFVKKVPPNRFKSEATIAAEEFASSSSSEDEAEEPDPKKFKTKVGFLDLC